MKFYHRTDEMATILRDGFRDGEGSYMTANTYKGVWLSDEPLDINEGAEGRYVLCIEMPEEAAADYEWIEEGKSFREFLVPAEVVNKFGVRSKNSA